MAKKRPFLTKLFFLAYLINNINIVSSTLYTIVPDHDDLGWRGFKFASIDLVAEEYPGSGTYDNVIYSSTQAFMCGFKISSVGDNINDELNSEGIDGFEAIFCH